MIPDFSKYSLAELRESLGIVDGRRNPENKAAIEAEIQARKDSGSFAEEERALEEESAALVQGRIEFALKAKAVIGWYMAVTGSFFVVSQVFWPPPIGSFGLAAILAISLAYMLATVFGGVALIREKSWAPIIAIALLSVQLFQFTSSMFSMRILSALGFYLNVGAEWTIGFSAYIWPGFWLAFNTYQPFLLGVNVLVAWLIYLLVTARNAVDR